MRVGVITFPGSLDERDAQRAVKLAGGEPVALWHGAHDLEGVEAIILPGGFSYGDTLGAGIGWARSINFNTLMADQFSAFFSRSDTFWLGVCN
mgnify:CR=1 FL=1